VCLIGQTIPDGHTGEAEAVRCAEEIGYPVVLKLFSETLTHKTDVDGVQLHLSGAEAVRNAYLAIATAVRDKAGAEHFLGVTVQPMISREGYELILGSSLDPQFGHDEKLQRFTGDILAENQGMREVCKKLGISLRYSPEDSLIRAELEL